jgi:large subunit ribosomal protein L24e
MKRNPRKVKWTKAYRKLHGKELTQDATFEFERRRNRPERYNREVVEQTLKAMKKIDEVRVQREAKFWENRMKDKKSKSRAEAARELEQGIHLIKAPSAMQSEPGLTLPKLAQKTKVKVSTSSNVEMQE